MKKFIIAAVVSMASFALAAPAFACGGAKAKKADACENMSCEGETAQTATADTDEEAKQAKKDEEKEKKEKTPSS